MPKEYKERSSTSIERIVSMTKAARNLLILSPFYNTNDGRAKLKSSRSCDINDLNLL